MVNRREFDLKIPLAFWSLILTVFSLIGSIYTIPILFNNFIQLPFKDSICDPSCYHHSAARWVFFFNVSKFFEFIDTIFIVLRKKPLIFLHWYHHIMTSLYCWYANQISCFWNCTGWWFASMNLFVHTLMYGYYTLSAFGYHVNGTILLTFLQILQMVIGSAIVLYSTSCPNSDEFKFGTYFALFMYLSYFILFANFFNQKYLRKEPKSKVD